MKDVIGFGSLSVSLFFQIRNPQSLDLKIEEFDKEGEKYSSPEHFRDYLNFVSHIGRKVWQHSGEEEANVILELANMGFDCGFVGKVGQDKFGDFLIENLKGVDTSRVNKEGFTGVSLVLVPEKGAKSSLVFPNSNNYLRFEELDLAYLNNAKFLHMGSFGGGVSFETQKRLAEEIAPSVAISFSIGKQNALRGLQSILPLIRRSLITFLNDQELTLLTGKEYKAGVKELLDYGTTIVGCQVENKGWYVASRQEDFFASTPPNDEDESNAAHLFIAGVLAGLLLAKPLEKCVAVASKLVARRNLPGGRNFPDKEFLDLIMSERETPKNSEKSMNE